MKRITSFFLFLSLILCAFVTLAGCNQVQPGKLSAIAGVYVLEQYDVTPTYDKNGNKLTGDDLVTTDKIAEYGMKVYVVITETGYGYYAYEDKNTPFTVTEMKQVCSYDDEDPALIREITFCDGENETHDFYVQAKKHTLTDNTGAWNLNLKIGKRNVPIGEKSKIEIRYKRVSKNGTLAGLEKELGKTLTPRKFTDTYLSGIFAGSTTDAGTEQYLYDYYDINTKTMTATRSYALAGTTEKRTETVAVSYDVKNNTLTLGDAVYTSYVNDNSFAFNRTETKVENGQVVTVYASLWRSGFTTLEEMNTAIDERIRAVTPNPQ